MVLAQKSIHGLEDPHMRSHSYSHLILTEITNKMKTNKQETHIGETIASSRNGGVRTGELQGGKWN